MSFGAASFLGTLGLIRGNEDGWASATVLGSLAASAVLLACFVVIERRAREPPPRPPGPGAAIAWPLLGEFAAPPSRAVS